MIPDQGRELPTKPLVIPEIISFPVELDVSNIDAVQAALRGAIRPGAGVVIADLTRTTFCDGAGMRCLLAAHDRAVACGVEMRAVIPSSAVWRLLVLVRGETTLPVYSNLEAGLTSSPAAARRPGPDDWASKAAGVFERSQVAMRAACDVAEQVAATQASLRRQRSAPDRELLQHSEFARLFKQVATMPVIEQAKGILMFYEHCTADEAFDMLRRASQRSNVPVREIADRIVQRTSSA